MYYLSSFSIFWLQTIISILKSFLWFCFSPWGHEKEENHQGSFSCNNNIHLKWPFLEIAWWVWRSFFPSAEEMLLIKASNPCGRYQPWTKLDCFPLSPLSSVDTFNQFPSDTAQSLSANVLFASPLHIARSLWCLYLSLVVQLRVFGQITAAEAVNTFTRVLVLWQTSACAGFTSSTDIKSEFFLCVHYNLILTSPLCHFQGQKQQPGTHSWEFSLSPSSTLPQMELLLGAQYRTYILSFNPLTPTVYSLRKRAVLEASNLIKPI